MKTGGTSRSSSKPPKGSGSQTTRANSNSMSAILKPVREKIPSTKPIETRAFRQTGGKSSTGGGKKK